MQRPRLLVVLAALCGTVTLAVWVEAGRAGLGMLGIERARAPIEHSRATSETARAEHVDAPRATALGEHGVSISDIANSSAALSDPPSMPQPAAPPALFAAVSPTDPVQNAGRPVTVSYTHLTLPTTERV